MDAEKAEVTTWVIVWDDLGLESLVNLTEIDCAETMLRLQEGSAPDGIARMLRMMQLRSRLNSHRNPEIWAFGVADTIDEGYMRRTFELNPEGFKRMIRASGIKQCI